MSENEVKVPLHNDGNQKSYSTMEKKSTGEIMNVGSNDADDFEQVSMS
jgi:hypothetical protein